MAFGSKLLGAACGAALMLAAGQASAQTQFLKINSGLAGTYPLYGGKLADVINKNVKGVQAAAVSGDSVQAQIDMQKGEIHYKIGYTYDVRWTADGKSTIPIKTPDVCHIQTLYGSGLFTVVKPDSPINTLADVPKGKYRMWVGPKSGIFYNLIVPTFESNGVALADVEKAGTVLETYGYADTVAGFQDRRLDITFFAGGYPYNMLQQLEGTPGVRFINQSPEALKKLAELRPGIGSKTMPANVYKGQTTPVNVPWFVNQLASINKVPDDIQYEVTKAVNEHGKEWHGLFPGSEDIGTVNPLDFNAIPVCKGAAKYYAEKGIKASS